MSRQNDGFPPRWAWIAAAVLMTTSTAFGGGLIVQRIRDGWPFSPPDPPVSAEPPRAASAPEEAPRMPVALARSRWTKMGIRVIGVRRETIGGEVRTAISIVPDETRVARVHAPFAGVLREARARAAGDSIELNEPLFTIVASDLATVQAQYLSSHAPALRERLIEYGMNESDVLALEHGEPIEVSRTIGSPRRGLILHVGASQGANVDPTPELFAIADLSQLWGVCDLPELDGSDLGMTSTGAINVPSSGEAAFEASIVSITRVPTEHRLHAAFALPPQTRLRIGMVGTVTVEVGARPALVVPRAAIVDTGSEHVFVLQSRSIFVPRTVRLGVQRGNRVEIASGLESGEVVASAGVFAIDAMSRNAAQPSEMGPSASL